jgi:putative SOS response-associated peptidase YedK
MCGRYTSSKPIDVYAELFKAKAGNLFVEPRYNIAPTYDVLACLAIPQSWRRAWRTKLAIATAESPPSRVKPSITPSLSRSERFWLTFHFPMSRAIGSSNPTIAPNICSM